MINRIESIRDKSPVERSPSRAENKLVFKGNHPELSHTKKISDTAEDFSYQYTQYIQKELTSAIGNGVPSDITAELLSYTSDGENPFFVVLHFPKTNTYVKGYRHARQGTGQWYTQVPGKRHTEVIDSIDDKTFEQFAANHSDLSTATIEQFERILSLQQAYLFPRFLAGNINRYNFLPDYLFCTDNYVFFEWFNDYDLATSEDFMKPITVLQKKIGGGESIQTFQPSDFFLDVISKFHNMYISERIDVPTGDIFLGDHGAFSPPDYYCVTPDNIAYHDFVVKRSSGKIVDWKFVDIGNFDIGHPRYIFGIDDQYPRNIPTGITGPRVICGDTENWYDLMAVDSIA
tara:strand:- start:233 stop:1270 length:1038 start_codon:yes stop_codon:yes gene_type:complete